MSSNGLQYLLLAADAKRSAALEAFVSAAASTEEYVLSAGILIGAVVVVCRDPISIGAGNCCAGPAGRALVLVYTLCMGGHCPGCTI
jgi:hypothetical protein